MCWLGTLPKIPYVEQNHHSQVGRAAALWFEQRLCTRTTITILRLVYGAGQPDLWRLSVCPLRDIPRMYGAAHSAISQHEPPVEIFWSRGLLGTEYIRKIFHRK